MKTKLGTIGSKQQSRKGSWIDGLLPSHQHKTKSRQPKPPVAINPWGPTKITPVHHYTSWANQVQGCTTMVRGSLEETAAAPTGQQLSPRISLKSTPSSIRMKHQKKGANLRTEAVLHSKGIKSDSQPILPQIQTKLQRSEMTGLRLPLILSRTGSLTNPTLALGLAPSHSRPWPNLLAWLPRFGNNYLLIIGKEWPSPKNIAKDNHAVQRTKDLL